jgi:type I restriction enzyme S subunit
VWCQLNFVCDIYTGNSINEQEKKAKYENVKNGYNYIGTKDVGFDRTIDYENGIKIPNTYIDSFRIAKQNSTLLCIEGGSAGRKIVIINQDVCFGNKLCCFSGYLVDNEYIYYYLQSPVFIENFTSNKNGIIGGVSVNTLKNLFFALPPIEEQKRIVNQLQKIEPHILQYEKLEQEETELTDKLPDNLKKSILQYAIQGKGYVKNNL